jgi:hypothetical protein
MSSFDCTAFTSKWYEIERQPDGDKIHHETPTRQKGAYLPVTNKEHKLQSLLADNHAGLHELVQKGNEKQLEPLYKLAEHVKGEPGTSSIIQELAEIATKRLKEKK